MAVTGLPVQSDKEGGGEEEEKKKKKKKKKKRMTCNISYIRKRREKMKLN